MRPSSWCVLALALVSAVSALNVTQFDALQKRTLVTSAQAREQWNVHVSCSLAFDEIYALYNTLLGTYASATSGDSSAVPCRLALSGQASTATLLVIRCDSPDATFGETLRQILTAALSDVCTWRLERDGVVRSKTTQTVSTLWHLDRIDQRELPLNGQYTYQRDGAGVTLWVLDTGCTNHSDFGGRMTQGSNYAGDGINTDCNGHGTGCASLAGGTHYGVAKAALIVCLKVLDCDGYGSYSGVALALMEVADYQIAYEGLNVVSMSLAGGFYEPINTQVNTLVNTYGVAVVVAAGNSGTNAASFSPASAAAAMTVAATYYVNGAEGLASYSNRGSIVDIAAPGSNVRLASYSNLNGYATMSGTSMACPIVAGAVALAMQQLVIDEEPATGAAAIALVKGMATVNKINDATDNYPPLPMLFLSIGQAPVAQPPPPPPPPPAPPLPPPQSNWAAPFTRPNTHNGASTLIVDFLASPIAIVLLLFLCCF